MQPCIETMLLLRQCLYEQQKELVDFSLLEMFISGRTQTWLVV